MRIETLPVGDNYIYVLIEGDRAAVVDPGVAEPVEAFLSSQGVALDLILITHYHSDHTGGVALLRRESSCRMAWPGGGAISVDPVVHDGDTVDFAGHAIEVLAVPGHSDCDVAYYLPDVKAVFTGDTLFAAGCGRVFGGATDRMWASLLRLRALPDETRLYGGHDYTLDNLEFAAHLEPAHAEVRARLARCRERVEAGLPIGSSTLAEEKVTNPFLRCDRAAVAKAVGMEGREASEVFARIRAMKDRW